jgi:hypothetical protein
MHRTAKQNFVTFGRRVDRLVGCRRRNVVGREIWRSRKILRSYGGRKDGDSDETGRSGREEITNHEAVLLLTATRHLHDDA